MPMETRESEVRRVRIELPADQFAPAKARRAVEGLGASIPPRCLQDLRLLVSEVVTNVVRHACFPDGSEPLMVMKVAVDEQGKVKASICDAGAGFEPPARPRPREDKSGDWGLYILDKISDRWGTRREGRLFCVWFELCG